MCFSGSYLSHRSTVLSEPRSEKTGLQGFWPGPTQTGLCSYRRWLEDWNFGFRKKRDCSIRVAKTKALISFAVTAKLICVFVFAYAKSQFSHDAAHLIQVNKISFVNRVLKLMWKKVPAADLSLCFHKCKKQVFTWRGSFGLSVGFIMVVLITLVMLGIFFRTRATEYFFPILYKISWAQGVSNSILGLNRMIPDHYRCHSHLKCRKPNQNRRSFHEKNGWKANKLTTKLFPCWPSLNDVTYLWNQ